MHDYDKLVAQGLARWYQGRLIPVMRGGDPAADDEPNDEALFAEVPEDLASLDDDALAALIEDYDATIAEVTSAPETFVTAELSASDLIAATREAMAARDALKAEAASRSVEEPVEPVGLTDEDREAFAALAADDTPDEEPVVEEEPVVAAAPRRIVRRAMPRPTAQHELTPPPAPEERSVSLLAAGGAHDILPGTRFNSDLELAEAMIERHRQFGATGPGTVEKFAIAKSEWVEEYPDERRMSKADIEGNFEIVSRIVKPGEIKKALQQRIADSLKGRDPATLVASGGADDFNIVASGGLCAPVTPYYNLQYISVPVRPVMGSLPSFQADRGGLRYARPAALSAVTSAVGIITEAEDALGGTSASKTCQIIPCPPFQETDVDIVYHCLQFGNLGARTFPELVAQWNNLVLAAHARLAESALLTHIDAFSTQVFAGHLGLGASATLFSQILAAANGLRNRNRMDPEAVLRLMLPWWAVDLIISDVIRTQFERFDTDQAKVTALLRSFNIEPTFYIDGASGRSQVFPTQPAGSLVPFPETVVWYLFPEGSFIYLDSGTLELGIVRDSVLNKTNDFQIFGETFENVAYVGVEALAVESWVCDSGTVSLPASVTCPLNYGVS